MVRKGMSANHVDTIRAFFKGVHVTLNARTEDEVEPEFIVKMVGKAVAGEGMKMSSSIDEEYITPVGAIYKKVNAQEEINAKAKDEFWRKDMAEEERRRREEVTRQRKFSQDEVRFLRKESQEYFDKEEEQLAEEKHQANVERMKKTSPLPKVNGTTINGGKSPINATSPVPPVMSKLKLHEFQECLKWIWLLDGTNSLSFTATNTAERTAALHASTPMKSTTNSDLVRKRIKSFDGGSGPVFPGKVNGVGGGGGGGAQVRKFSSPVSPSVRSPSPPKNGEQKQEKMALPSVQKRKQMFEGGSPSSANTATRRNPAEEIRLAQEEAKKQQEKEKEKEKSIKVAQKIKQEEPEERTVVSPTAHYQAPVVESPAPVKQQPAFFNNPTSTVTKSPSPEPAPVPVVAKAPSPMPAKSPEPRKIDSPVPAPPQFANNTNGASPTPVVEGETITINITPEMGTCARALYDYQAGMFF